MSVARAVTLIIETSNARRTPRRINDSILYMRPPLVHIIVDSGLDPELRILMRYSRQFFLATLWMLFALPLGAQVAGFPGADNDRDGLPDDFEQAILDKFKPTWKVSATDCDILPSEFLPGVANPTFKAKNGTIY